MSDPFDPIADIAGADALSSCVFRCCCSSSEEDTTGIDGGVGVSIRLNRCPIRAILALLMTGFIAAAASLTTEGMSGGRGWVNRAVLGAAAASEHGFDGGELCERCKNKRNFT